MQRIVFAGSLGSIRPHTSVAWQPTFFQDGGQRCGANRAISRLSPQGGTRAMRCAAMRRIRQRNTKPEMAVRKIAHRLGYRFRLHQRNLPGCPDLVFASARVVIFVHGCFWHQHKGCNRSTIPKTRRAYWAAKLKRNTSRDRATIRKLRRLGWRVLLIWECDTRKPDKVERRLSGFLKKTR